MSLLKWLFGQKARDVATPDLIWLTADAALRGLLARLEEARREGRFVLVSAPFEQQCNELERAIARVGFQLHQHPEPLDVDVVAAAARRANGFGIWLVTNRQFVETDIEPETIDESVTVTILVRERHPLRSVDDNVLRFARCLPVTTSTQFLVSLEDLLLKRFISDSISSMLKQLGLQPDEVIESSLVARSIARAQQKIAAEALDSSGRAYSAEEWFAANLPEPS